MTILWCPGKDLYTTPNSFQDLYQEHFIAKVILREGCTFENFQSPLGSKLVVNDDDDSDVK